MNSLFILPVFRGFDEFGYIFKKKYVGFYGDYKEILVNRQQTIKTLRY